MILHPEKWDSQKEAVLVAAVVRAVPDVGSHETFPLGDNREYICVNCHLVDVEGQITDKCLIGRPITLEDILAALSKISRAIAVSYSGMFVEIGPSVSTDGNMKNTISHPKECESNFDALYWSLGKPLSYQSPETKLFLYSLLVSQ